jgi:signal transduction histidine kinase
MRPEDDVSGLTRTAAPLVNVRGVTAAAAPFLVRRLGHAQLLAIDAGLAVAVALLCWYAASEPPLSMRNGWDEPAWVSVLTGVALAAPVAIRRRWPVTAVGAIVVVAGLSLASGVIPDFAGSGPMVALGLGLYTLGAIVEAWRSAVVGFACIALIAAAFLYAAHSPFEASFAALVLCACWAIGRMVRERRAYAIRSTEQATARAVDEERLRIAREIHDIVAHSMSLIAVKATIADHVADERPQEMREALRVIASTSRDALGDLRLALGALRVEPAYAPTPGMAQLAGLADAAKSAGVAVDLRIVGDIELPDGVAQAVFRIVQEALTNVVKHAGATHCRVEVDIGPEEVRIEAIDDGRSSDGRLSETRPSEAGPFEAQSSESGPPEVSGQGLIGMRERVALFGGRFAAGPRQPRGWLVSATLRYER